ncbi:glycosyltransferase family 2 protein [Rhizobium mongolense]|uniref:glycosyltransferase family 2 protein n=1 Tax=Rhizobium mongolense TaxID=57676 RepID=UPI0034A3B66D
MDDENLEQETTCLNHCSERGYDWNEDVGATLRDFFHDHLLRKTYGRIYELPSDKQTCDVSVVIPTFNRSKFLRRALSSVQAQTMMPAEVLVIDDCSNEAEALATERVVEEFSASLNLILLRNSVNRGANYSRNRGISTAKHRYIAFLDSDDFWMPEKLSRQIEILSQKEEGRAILCVTGRYRVAGESGKIIARQLVRSDFSRKTIIQSNFIGTLSSVLVDATLARAVSGFDEALPACQDWEFFIRISQNINFLSVSAPLCVYVEHQENRISASNRNRLRGHLFIKRKYIESLDEKLDLSAFYRNVGEELQLLGRGRMARRIYIKSLTEGIFPAWRGSLAQAMLHIYYTWRRMPLLKTARYLSYREKFARLEARVEELSQLRRDQDFIYTAFRRW